MAIEIAKIVKPQGIKGEVKARPLTNVLSVFKGLKTASVDGVERKIKSISLRQGFIYVLFEGVTTRNDAENLRNKTICIPKDILESVKGEDFLIDDLIGMTLYDLDGNYVGQIVDVENYGAGDILIIESEGRDLEVPYLKKVFITKGDKLVVDRKAFDEVAI